MFLSQEPSLHVPCAWTQELEWMGKEMAQKTMGFHRVMVGLMCRVGGRRGDPRLMVQIPPLPLNTLQVCKFEGGE